MDSIKVKTPYDFSSTSPKRKKHSTIACASCRKLRIRCSGGIPPGKTNRTKPCSHCLHLNKDCLWPEEDGRKRPRATVSDPSDPAYCNTPTSDETISVDDGLALQPAMNDANRLSLASDQEREGRPSARSGNAGGLKYQPLNNNQTQDSYTTIHYYRELGPTAIAPGHKQISVKVQQPPCGSTLKDPSAPGDHFSATSRTLPLLKAELDATELPSLFDDETSLPVADVLPDLLDAFFMYYADNFCFLNRSYLDQLLSRGEASHFLVCSMAALSSRFCDPVKLAKYFQPKEDGSLRQGWELSNPFLERAKILLMPLLGIPSCDVVGGMVLLSLAEFGNNSESGRSFTEMSLLKRSDHGTGMWMFTGMAVRMAQEIGLHRERPSRGMSVNQSPTNQLTGEDRPFAVPREADSDLVGLDEFEKSTQIILFWCVYSMDVNLCNGTGRVPCIKRHEISVRLPNDRDMALMRAGPGGTMKPLKPEVYPAYANMVRHSERSIRKTVMLTRKIQMLSYARSIDFLNTESSEVYCRPPMTNARRKELVAEIKEELMTKYRSIPREVSFGAIYYQAAVKSGLAAYVTIKRSYFKQQLPDSGNPDPTYFCITNTIYKLLSLHKKTLQVKKLSLGLSKAL
ncbi:MAG: hypothetical protein LQ344_005041 [Seirophora lacunosa]|nr:MAG: hypothetical protein LQ344_005041 [Seirophora lacunosa]